MVNLLWYKMHVLKFLYIFFFSFNTVEISSINTDSYFMFLTIIKYIGINIKLKWPLHYSYSWI